MIIETDYTEREECLMFIGDLTNGETLCQCPCGQEVIPNELINSSCTKCGRVHKYPAWASW
jgi:hypothetical protein